MDSMAAGTDKATTITWWQMWIGMDVMKLFMAAWS